MEENLKKFFFQFYIKKCILQHQHLKQVRMYFCFYFIVFFEVCIYVQYFFQTENVC